MLARLRPVPIRVRPVHGETPESYGRRLAQANGVSARELERYIAETAGQPATALSSSETDYALRRLGLLSREALTTQRRLEGQGLRVRAGCVRCGGGRAVTVRLLDRGLVCLKHRWWFGTHPQSVTQRPEVLAAERMFRRHLAARGAPMDGHAMRIGGECASRAEIVPSHAPDSPGIDVDLYPAQVRVARILAHGSIMIPVTDPDRPDGDRRAALADALHLALGPTTTFSFARAFNHLWSTVYEIERSRREARARDEALSDPYDLVRLWNY